MDGSPGRQEDRATWTSPRARDQGGVARYLAVLRERAGLILIVAAVCTIAAGVYVARSRKQYQTHADLLVTPAPDTLLPELSLLRSSSDPTVDVETIARLVTSNDVASLARGQLANSESVVSLLGHVQAVPVAGSTVVAITAESPLPDRAQMIANAFADATVQHETMQLQTALVSEAQRLQTQIAGLPRGEPATVVSALAQQLTSIEALLGGQDPTLRVLARAAQPTSAASPRPLRSIAAALLAGLVLGVGVALAFHGLDPVLRREEQLEARYALPVLAQIPAASTGRRMRLAGRLRHRSAAGPLVPGRAPPSVLDAYRSLPPVLTATARAASAEGSGPRSILVTSPSASEGKTTTAISLAWSLAAGGDRVILIEADFRHPAIGRALGISSQVGTGALLDSVAADRFRRPRTPATLEDALVPARFHGVEVEVLLAGSSPATGATMLDLLSSGGPPGVISLAKRRADFVVIDSPALSEAMETLSLAQEADELLLVVALGETRIARLDHLAELLVRYDVWPAGFVVVGGDRGASRRAYPAGRADSGAGEAQRAGTRASARGVRAPRPPVAGQDAVAPGGSGSS